MYKYSSNLVLKQVRKARRKINKKLCLGGEKKKSERCCCCCFPNAVRWFVKIFTFLEDNVKL